MKWQMQIVIWGREGNKQYYDMVDWQERKSNGSGLVRFLPKMRSDSRRGYEMNYEFAPSPLKFVNRLLSAVSELEPLSCQRHAGRRTAFLNKFRETPLSESIYIMRTKPTKTLAQRLCTQMMSVHCRRR